MNERLKFRAWDKEEKKYLDGHLCTVKLDMSGELVLGFEDDMIFGNSEFIIEKCTGLKDKNGKLIYEGDVLNLHNQTGLSGNIVEYEGGGFKPFAVPGWECTPDCGKCEIIGNIHELGK